MFDNHEEKVICVSQGEITEHLFGSHARSAMLSTVAAIKSVINSQDGGQALGPIAVTPAIVPHQDLKHDDFLNG